MKKTNKVSAVTLSIALIFSLFGPIQPVSAVGVAPSLGSAGSFGVLAGAAVSDTASSSDISGDVGLSPTGGTAITVLSCSEVTGTIYDTNAGYTGGHDANTGCLVTNAGLLITAKADVSSAYNNVELQASDFAVVASTTDSFAAFGYVLTPGVYNSGSSMGVPVALTLDGGGDPDAVFIFQAGSTLNTVVGSTITLINGAKASNVFWQVGTSATIGVGSNFKGTIMAAASITDDGGSTILGRLLADADNTDADSSGAVTLNNTSLAVPSTLHVIKTVINNDGGVAVAGDFTVHVEDGVGDVTGSPQPGEGSPGTAYELSAGTFTVSEDAFAGYSVTFGGDCAVDGTVTLASGADLTCTVTNNDNAAAVATLHIVKTVINDNGGTAVASDFTIDVAGTNVSNPSFAGSAAGVDVTLDAGAYAVTEVSLPGYLQSGSGDCSGNILAGETKDCTITNNDIAPQLIVNKIVINNNGGTKVVANFPLFLDGAPVASGVATTTTVGSHTVTETTDPGYTSVIGGDCAANGTVTLALGEVKTCTVTNDDIAPPAGGGGGNFSPVPPLINVVKVPSPLSLPDGAGEVTYTYTLTNIGTSRMNNISVVDDTCSPLTLISGDTNTDFELGVSEVWTYTCTTDITETHTNIVTATGHANGITATDIANATVVVGLPIIPPLINVTKVPSPVVLPAGGGMVTYTNKVTNPGTVPLSNVRLTDDKCSAVNYISGDTNGDSMLDVTETWTYTCTSRLNETTVNTVTARGDANGLTAIDFAIVTVIVDVTQFAALEAPFVPEAPVVVPPAPVVPKLPNTGLPLSENNTPWNVVPAGLGALILFYFVRRKRSA